MSVNIPINTTIKLPLALVAAIQAADHEDVEDLQDVLGIETVAAGVNAAVIAALKELPYRVHPAQPVKMEDSAPTASSGVTRSPRVTVKVRSSMRGTIHQFIVPLNYKVGKLKKRLHEKGEVSPWLQRLLSAADQRMRDKLTIGDYEVEDGDTLNLHCDQIGS